MADPRGSAPRSSVSETEVITFIRGINKMAEAADHDTATTVSKTGEFPLLHTSVKWRLVQKSNLH